jgi:hypothetical protein
MPLFEVSISKRLTVGSDNKRWSNNYHVEAADLGEALDFAVDISVIEQKIHKDYVLFSYANAREAIPDPPPGGQRALTGFGDIVGDPAIRLPNFNAVRCILSDENGRPSQKYLRLPLEEGEVTDGVLSAALINSVQLEYLTDLLLLAFIRSNSGDIWTAASVAPNVQMRQQDWNRRTRVGFHRGWVPNP